ncbi:MAG TPA: O-antigen ligase family protein, partial [Planctomycetota bacterium]|nr:O-antigen ligase family protein [Planctomycetota bacterium]
MLILRLFQVLALWALTAAVWAHAWMTSAAASAYDARVRFGVLLCLAAWGGGTLLGALMGRWKPAHWPAPGLHRHVLALLATALCVDALSHVAPQVSIRVLREEVPPFLGWMYPALAALTPLLLRRSAQRFDFARQTLLLALFATAMSGAMFFLLPPVALGLALLALGWQFDARHGLPARSALLALAALTVLVVCTASHFGYSRLAGEPSETWLLACTALGLAIAVRPRDGASWRQLLGTTVLAAVVVALCGALVTAWLGRVIAWEPALHSRLVLFRQHPNFLAPFFGFHAVLALALGLSRPRRALPWLAAALLLAGSAWLTDSRTGFAALLASVAVLALLPLAARAARRVRLPVLAAAALGGVLLLGGAWLLAGGDSARATLAARFDRFEKSLDFRRDAWRNSVSIIRQHPVIGIGPATFLAVERFEPGSRFFNAPEAPHPHNVFLYVAQAAGLPALALFLAWTAALAVALLSRAARPEPGSGDELSLPVPPLLVWGLAAALGGLLVANLFDLGLALETVVPAPLVVFTGLALSSRRPREGACPRWHPLLAGAVLLAAFVPLVLSPLRARTAVEQAQLQAYDAGQQPSVGGLMEGARLTLAHALELDPAVPKAHELLSRWREDLPGGFPAARDVLIALTDLAPRD